MDDKKRPLDFTPAARRLFFDRVWRAEQAAALRGEAGQREILGDLLRQGSRTIWGCEHGLRPSMTYEAFASTQPLLDYDKIEAHARKMAFEGRRDLLWPGRIAYCAKSSGTSGPSKYIPLTGRSLRRCHLRGGAFSVASYLHYHPDSRLFAGKNFPLVGSYDAPARGRARAGDLSATLFATMPGFARRFRAPSSGVALMSDWREKLPALARDIAAQDIRSLSGVPSWMLGVVREVLRLRGADTLREVWPRLEVFFHGGIAYGPYRQQYADLAGTPSLRTWENYNASEGFWAVQDRPGESPMRLLMNVDTFYEFLPVGAGGRAVPSWQVEPGGVYALVVTSSNGLWRYNTGDTVRIEQAQPYVTLTVAGRTRSFINAFGEEVMVHNTDAAVARASALTGAAVADYTVAPVYPAPGRRGRHQWLVEFAAVPREGLEAFAHALDRALQEANSDYRAKRQGSLFMDPPEVVTLPAGTFDRWLLGRGGRLGGQRKIPRLSNDRSMADALLDIERR